ncbi:MAG: response regulator transcription factor [Actinomycetota bacterium]
MKLEPRLADGEAALGAGEWQRARDAFEATIEGSESPEAHDGLGLALWWLRDVDGALEHRGRAFAGFRRAGETSRAARTAMWLAWEYAEALGNEPLSRGWLARAEGSVRDSSSELDRGWLAFTRARLRLDDPTAREEAAAAVVSARRSGDADLEAMALALHGLIRVAGSEVDGGMSDLDEALVIATGGEVSDQAVFGDVCCMATRAAEEAGDVSRLMRWNEVVMAFMERSGHLPLLTFCGTCCAEVLLANGQLEEAEGWLARSLGELEATGHRARCVHPAAKLAELRILQGRVEEAERLLAGYEEQPDAQRAVAAVHLAKGETAVAAALLLRRLHQTGEGMLAVPLLSLLVQVQVAQPDPVTAAVTAGRLESIAVRVAQPRVTALAGLARGRAELAAGRDEPARRHLESAVESFVGLRMPLETASARIELARALRNEQPEVAANEARLAMAAAESAGAGHLADRAAALVRELGGPARTGPKGVGLLTAREIEVLRLLRDGLTNAEIAARLYISTKTAGNHVSNLLAKLQLRSRQEAAVYATRYLDP